MALAKKNTGSRHSWQKLKSMADVKSQTWNLGPGLNMREKTVFTQHTKFLEKIYILIHFTSFLFLIHLLIIRMAFVKGTRIAGAFNDHD